MSTPDELALTPEQVDELLREHPQYPQTLAGDSYWREDLAEALNNALHFTEPAGSVRYEDYRYVGTHNAFVYNRLYGTVRQQDQTILGQLAYGVRGLMLDTHDWPASTIATKLGSGDVALAHGGFGAGTYIQKASTTFQTLKYELRRVIEFMKVNTNAVITIILEDYADPGVTSREIQEAVVEAGLGVGELLYTPADHQATRSRLPARFPTLNWMRTKNKRLVIFTQNAQATATTFHQFDHFFENIYGTSDEVELCSERVESAASGVRGRRLVAFNHFPGVAQGAGVTPTTAMQKWRVEYGTAAAILAKAEKAGFAGGRTFNGYWADRVIDCVNHLGEGGELSIFDYVNDLNAGHSRFVEPGHGYRITSAGDRSFHLAMYEGSLVTVGSTAVHHQLISALSPPPQFLSDGAQVYLRTTAQGAGTNVFINAERWYNLWYNDNAGTDEEWTVERRDKQSTGPLRFGEKVRFKSRRQSKDAGAPRYLSRESDNYVATRGAVDSDSKNKGIVWVIER